MDISQMRRAMCHSVLTQADINAICKQRGFSNQEAGNRDLFENFYLTDVGLEKVMGMLTQAEVIGLHLLRHLGQAVDVSFFARIYQAEAQHRYGTFNQRYGDVFKSVKTSLVRKGILLLAEAQNVAAKTKLERWQFRLPPEFEPFLPPLLVETTSLVGEGDVRTEVLREKLLEVTEGPLNSPLPDDQAQPFSLCIKNGTLRIGDRLFKKEYLRDWQLACWTAAVPEPEKKLYAMMKQAPFSLKPVEALRDILAQLGPEQWVRPEQLAEPVRIFCNGDWDIAAVCLVGWYWACLARQKVDDQLYYRLADLDQTDQPDPDPIYYLDRGQRGAPMVNLKVIPLSVLEQLNRIADLEASDLDSAYPRAKPSLIKLGHSLAVLRDTPLLTWLGENEIEFREAFETVEARWGKQLVHTGLLVAKVDDLGLKVQLERAFPDRKKMRFLPDDYIAFPRDLLPAVERLIAKSGHVIRKVSADA